MKYSKKDTYDKLYGSQIMVFGLHLIESINKSQLHVFPKCLKGIFVKDTSILKLQTSISMMF